MAAAVAGVLPHQALDYTHRMLAAALEAEQTRQKNGLALAIITAHNTENFARTKRLPRLQDVLRKLWPPRVMSAKEQHASIMAMARAMGARVIHRKKGEA